MTGIRSNWDEISVDLFTTPLRSQKLSVCANIQVLPFKADTFGCVVCVGEVLAYCDPAQAISELARVLASSGLLICDFGSTTSARYAFTHLYGRAADIVTDHYNGSPEKIWVYSPQY
jgi:ubiquinone/menaquinone biosynthesis C-methylase UbiE